MKRKQINSKNKIIQLILDAISIVQHRVFKENSPSYWVYELLIRPAVAELFHGNPRHAIALFRFRFRLLANQGATPDPYLFWIIANEPIPQKQILQTPDGDELSQRPLISIVTPVYHPPADALEAMLSSVISQSYGLWEHCIVNADPEDKNSKERISVSARKDKRILTQTLEQNFGIAENTNEAIKMAHGEWIAFLDHDDQLSPDALYEVVKLINEHPEVDVIYSDEDKIRTFDKYRFSPFFKPDFNLDYLRSLNYMTHFLVVRKELGDTVGWLDSQFDGAQDFDLVLKLAEKTCQIFHLPKILYHWKAVEGSAAGSNDAKVYAVEAGERALAAHLKRSGQEGQVVPGQFPYQPRYTIAGQPKVSIVIPNRDNSPTLRRLLDSVFQKSTYPNFEIVLVENGSNEKETFDYYADLEKRPNVKIVEWKNEFNYSLVNNYGEEHSSGDVLLLLNNDLEVINEDWLERMLEHALRSEIGAVGAKLYYPNDSIQHAGVIVGMFGAAGHSHKFYKRESPGYYNRLFSIQNYSAVTAACLMIRREIFHEVGGLDPVFKIEFGDVDFCLRVLSRGYRNLWTPFAQLYHYESLTRGGGYETKEKRQLNRSEVTLFQTRWKKFIEQGDPCYNPNLSLEKEDFGFPIG